MEHEDWHYNDLKQIGLDFGDADQVATYDDRRHADLECDCALAD